MKRKQDLGAQLEDAGKTIWLFIGYVALLCAIAAVPFVIVALFTHDWLAVPRGILWMIRYVFGLEPEYPGQPN